MSTGEAEYLNRLRAAAAAMRKMQAQLDAARAARTEGIAVIGMACRMPGGGSTPERFWRVLADGTDTIQPVPSSRWKDDPFGHGNNRFAEENSTRWGGFLREPIDGLDAEMFGITPREAVRLDPQQRLLLEVTWEALERAGQIPESLMGTATGVFIGINTNDYEQYDLATDPARLDIYTATGNGHCFPPGRISYTLGLQGPSMAVDTACSSSLVAVHLACQSLRASECRLAISGGVNLMVLPWLTHLFARSQALAPDGRCKTFDARANGYVRGEGCGVVILKRLSDALSDGDTILGVIRGSAVNQDGRSAGLTAPNVLAQSAMLRQALESAGVAPSEVSYVETHGTGTALGDPIEFEALAEVVGKPRQDGSKCVLGAVKSNVGHLEAAAGVTGLVKVLLSLQHEAIPGNLHFKRLNPRMSLAGTPFVIPARTVEWKRTDRPRIAGISSFGISGTNAHVVVEEAPVSAVEAAAVEGPQLVPMSARTAEGVRELAAAYGHELAQEGSGLGDVAYTASRRRGHQKQRLAVVGANRSDVAARLEQYLRDGTAPGVMEGKVGSGKPVFVFPGQGSQWLGMGRELLERAEPFRRAVSACDEAIGAEAGWSVIKVLMEAAEGERLNEIDVVQPVLFAMSVALAAQWRAMGVEPETVVGHSMGEVAAAYVGGMLTLGDAAAVICRRSRLLKRVSGQGAMAVVELTVEEVERELGAYKGKLSMAVSNSRRSTVVSGDLAAVDALMKALEAREVFCRRVKVDVASHSPQMDGLRAELMEGLKGIRPQRGEVKMWSTVVGGLVEGPELDASYWASNLREPVQFRGAMEKLLAGGSDLFIEMSPHPVLVPAIDEAIRDAGAEGAAVGSLRREQSEWTSLLESLGKAYAHGGTLDWAALHPGGRVVPLPTYPWQRERFWIDDSPLLNGARTSALLPVAMGAAEEPLIGREQRVPIAGIRAWQNVVGPAAMSYLMDHQVGGGPVFPGAGYVEMAWRAARTWAGDSCALEDVKFERLLSLDADSPATVQVVVTEEGNATGRATIASQGEDGAWIRHASASVRPARASRPATGELEAIRGRCQQVVAPEALYTWAGRHNVHYGPAFRPAQRIWRGQQELLAELVLPDGLVTDGYSLHPVLLDGCMQAGSLLVLGDSEETFVAAGASRIDVYGALGARSFVHARQRDAQGNARLVDLTVYDETGRCLLEVDGLRAERLPADAARPEPLLLQIGWRSVEAPPRDATRQGADPWLALAHRDPLADRVIAGLRQAAQRVVVVRPGPAFRQLDADLFEVDPASAANWRELLATALGDRTCAGILHSWSLEARPVADTTPQSLVEDQALAVVSGLALAQAVVEWGAKESPRLWFISRDAQAVPTVAGADDGVTADVQVAQAPIWALSRVLGVEHPELRGTCIDLGGHDTLEDQARNVLEELLSSQEAWESQIAWRGRQRYAARLVRGANAPDEAMAFKADATYLITGGLGGLGLALASWMAEQGARHLLLMGRSAPSEEAKAVLDRLRALGCRIEVARGDVARPDDVAATLAAIGFGWPQLRGIVHAAGVIDDATLLQQDAERFRKVMAPKVLGAWNLHAATEGRELDFFVLYSSAASLVGSAGQANYVAANAFLDALAHHRRSRGLPALTVNWGAFAGVGLAAAASVRGNRLSDRGAAGMSTEEGHRLLARLLRASHVQVGVLRFDVERWLDYLPAAIARSPFWSELVDRQLRAEASPSGGERARLVAAAPEERPPLVEAIVLAELARVVRQDANRIAKTESFQRLGLDSLMRLELRNRLEARLELQIATSLLAQFPNVGSLAARLAADLEQANSGTVRVASAQSEAQSSRPTWVGLTARGAQARARLFCVPGAGASSSFFRTWTREVPAGLDLCVVELPGHGLRLGEPTLSTVEETAARMLEALAPVMAEMPFAIFGHSMGGLISYELIRKAAARGLAPDHLFVSSAAPPDWPATVSKRLKGLSDAEFLELCRQEGFISPDIDRAHDAELARSYVPVIRGDFLMAESYDRRNLTAIDVPISAFAARDDSMVSAQLMEGWARFSTGRFALDVVDGDHFSARGQGAVFLSRILGEFGDGLHHRNRRSELEPSLSL